MKKYNISVMDFNTVKIYLYNTTISKSADMDPDNWISEAVEMFISSKGHHLSECHYMFSEDVIEVITNKLLIMKFKVGDIVVGNQFANDRYNVTKKGWQGRVTLVKANTFRAVGLLDDTGGSCGFGLEYKYFDLLKSTEEVNNYEIF